MIEIKLVKQLHKLSKLSDQLSKKQAGTASVRAINRAIIHSKGVLRRAIQQQYRIPSSELKDFSVFRANIQNMTGKLGVRRMPLSLAHFNPRFISVSSSGNTSIRVRKTKGGLTKVFSSSRTKKPAKGVSIEIKKGERKVLPYAFLIKNDNQKPVFARGSYKGGNGSYEFVLHKPRMPINKILSTSVAGASKHPAVRNKIMIDATDYFAKRLEHEIRYLISKV